MFNSTIFKQTLRSNLKLWLIFTLVTGLFSFVIIAVFEPGTISSVSDMVEGTPLANLLPNTTFLGMLASTFYSIHGVLLPIIYIIITANSLIAAQVDRGSMAYLLSTPTKRSAVVNTQAAYLILSLVIMFGIVTLIGTGAIQLFQRNVDMDWTEFWLLNLGLFLMMFANSGISFLASCLFNLTKHSLAFGAGLPLAFFLFDLMAQMDDSLEGFKYVTLNTLFDTDAILQGEGMLWRFGILAVIGVVMYVAGSRVFQRKDLPL